MLVVCRDMDRRRISSQATRPANCQPPTPPSASSRGPPPPTWEGQGGEQGSGGLGSLVCLDVERLTIKIVHRARAAEALLRQPLHDCFRDRKASARMRS